MTTSLRRRATFAASVAAMTTFALSAVLAAPSDAAPRGREGPRSAGPAIDVTTTNVPNIKEEGAASAAGSRRAANARQKGTAANARTSGAPGVAGSATPISPSIAPTSGAQPGVVATLAPTGCPFLPPVLGVTENVKLSALSWDFGDGSLVNNEAECFGRLNWTVANNTVTPRLTGKLFAKNAIGDRGRMQLKYYDAFGNLLNTRNGTERQALTNDETAFDIDLGGYSHAAIDRVDIAIQTGNPWANLASQSYYLSSAVKAPDSVLIAAVGQDFGSGGALVNGQPPSSGTLTWELAGNVVKPRLTGTLYLKNSSGTRARMQLKSYNRFGGLVRTTNGTYHEATSNAEQEFAINLAPTTGDATITKVEVRLMVDVFGTDTQVGDTITVEL